MTTTQDIRQAVHQAMPTAIDNLKQLVSIPSIATQGYPREQVLEAARITETQLKAVGFQQVHHQAKHRDGTAHHLSQQNETDASTGVEPQMINQA